MGQFLVFKYYITPETLIIHSGWRVSWRASMALRSGCFGLRATGSVFDIFSMCVLLPRAMEAVNLEGRMRHAQTLSFTSYLSRQVQEPSFNFAAGRCTPRRKLSSAPVPRGARGQRPRANARQKLRLSPPKQRSHRMMRNHLPDAGVSHNGWLVTFGVAVVHLPWGCKHAPVLLHVE